MTLVEHLYELRNRLAIALVAVGVTTVFGYIWYDIGLFGSPSLGELLKAPYCAIPEAARATFTADGRCTLAGDRAVRPVQPAAQGRDDRRRRAGVPGLALPALGVHHPGLYSNERRYALSFVSVAAVLFVAGAVLAYFVVTQGLQVPAHHRRRRADSRAHRRDYFGFVIALLLIFGVSFEIPLLVVMLNLAGVLSYAKLKAWRRGLIFGLFVFAAVATPGGDPFSMLALALALVVLFELAIQVARLNDRRTARPRGRGAGTAGTPTSPHRSTPARA